MRKVYLLLDGDNDITLCKRKLGKIEGSILSELELDNLAEKLMYAYIRKEDVKLNITYYHNLLIKHKELKALIYDVLLFSKYFEEVDGYLNYKMELVEKEEKLTLSLIDKVEDKLKYINQLKKCIVSPYRKEAFDIRAVDMNTWATCEMSFRELNKKLREKALKDKEEELKKEKEEEINEKMFESQLKDFIEKR